MFPCFPGAIPTLTPATCAQIRFLYPCVAFMPSAVLQLIFSVSGIAFLVLCATAKTCFQMLICKSFCRFHQLWHYCSACFQGPLCFEPILERSLCWCSGLEAADAHPFPPAIVVLPHFGPCSILDFCFFFRPAP